MKKKIIIVANGRLYPKIIQEIQRNDFIIGVDRAAFWLTEQGIVPDVAVGDFDSCTPSEVQIIKQKVKHVQSYIPEKDFTDTELAIELALKQKPKEIVIYGGLGSRFDHTLGAVLLLERYEAAGVHATMKDEKNDIRVVGRGRTILEKREGYRYISIIPVTDTIQISLSQLKYTLKDKIIRRGQTIGISNEFIKDKAVLTVTRGKALVIQSKD